MEPQLQTDPESLRRRYRETRAQSLKLVAPLEPEDFRIQSMPDVSPPWWNLGHTTWFFAKNILEPRAGYSFPHAGFEYVLNSYYESHGPRLPRHQRGLVTRPSTEEVLELRRDVDRRMLSLLDATKPLDAELEMLIEAGIQHEQQHQELLVTEIKHIRSVNAPGFRHAYRQRLDHPTAPARAACWLEVPGGVCEIGNLEGGWCWDNELPVHKTYLEPFALASRLITAGEFLHFIEDDGYREPLLWLANGWARASSEGWCAPLYWQHVDGEWRHWTLAGDQAVRSAEPVCHVSYYEADAYATWRSQNDSHWRGARLPTEHEWEHAARQLGFSADQGNFLEDDHNHPRTAQSAGPAEGAFTQAAGDLWEWTSSHYQPYPGYQPFPGSLMEYNGKFMDNQRVLRGGSCATPRRHIRPSYRNFWPAETRFQFTGLRLARSA